MKFTVTTLAKISIGNPKMCLLPIRALNMCCKCHLYENCKSKRQDLEYEGKLNIADKLNQQAKSLQQKAKQLIETHKN